MNVIKKGYPFLIIALQLVAIILMSCPIFVTNVYAGSYPNGQKEVWHTYFNIVYGQSTNLGAAVLCIVAVIPVVLQTVAKSYARPLTLGAVIFSWLSAGFSLFSFGSLTAADIIIKVLLFLIAGGLLSAYILTEISVRKNKAEGQQEITAD